MLKYFFLKLIKDHRRGQSLSALSEIKREVEFDSALFSEKAISKMS
jgi:hypothetical protein